MELHFAAKGRSTYHNQFAQLFKSLDRLILGVSLGNDWMIGTADYRNDFRIYFGNTHLEIIFDVYDYNCSLGRSFYVKTVATFEELKKEYLRHYGESHQDRI